MEISLFLIPGKLVSDQNQSWQLRKSEAKFKEPPPLSEVGHID